MNDRKIILDSIRVIFQAVRLSSKSTELSLGLSAAQLFVLQKLEEKEGLSINELARGTLTHQSSVSVVVSKLVASGLVCRSVSKRDRRRIELTLTEKGREVLSGAPEALQTRLIKALDEFSCPLDPVGGHLLQGGAALRGGNRGDEVKERLVGVIMQSDLLKHRLLHFEEEKVDRRREKSLRRSQGRLA
jgi:DNA-binding MarR family transcriptional regulator